MSAEKWIYEICIKDHLDVGWASWFEGFTLTHSFSQDGMPVTTLSGALADQAALHGVLIKLRDLGIPILSLNRIESDKGGDR